jgi:signal transduction histidine kinase
MQVEAEAARARRILERVRDCVSLGRVVAAPADMVEIAQKVAHSCSGAPSIKVTGAANVPKVMGDTVQIEQALLNLITNALDAVSHRTDRAGIVHIHITQRLGRIAVEISDDGPGIAEEMQEPLFEPFETTKPNGMGLGLFLSRQIAEAHGGSLSWRRLEPQGTCFILEIPIDGPTQYRA